MTKGRWIGIAFGLFAVVCLVFTWDYSKGRITRTDSPLISDVLAATTARECARDATTIALRHIPLGTAQAEVETQLASLTIEAPNPWFWRAHVENATSWDGDTVEALRTIKATAFGDQLLRLHMTFAEGRLRRLAGEVICRFE